MSPLLKIKTRVGCAKMQKYRHISLIFWERRSKRANGSSIKGQDCKSKTCAGHSVHHTILRLESNSTAAALTLWANEKFVHFPNLINKFFSPIFFIIFIAHKYTIIIIYAWLIEQFVLWWDGNNSTRKKTLFYIWVIELY